MTGNFKNTDLRILKTYDSLLFALPKLLRRRNFLSITVNDLCEEAKLSRVAFYSHFKDKYDLLSYWLTNVSIKLSAIDPHYENLSYAVNYIVKDNSKIITNILEGANGETMDLLHGFVLSFIDGLGYGYRGGFSRDERRICKECFITIPAETRLKNTQSQQGNYSSSPKKELNDYSTNKKTVLSGYFAGGIINLMYWQIKNKFPAQLPFMNPHVYEVILLLQQTVER